MGYYEVEFEPVGRRGKCRDDESVLDCAHRLGVGIVSLCGGRGKFHCCKIQIIKGSVSKPTKSEIEFFSSEELKDGYRLACQTYLKSNCKIKVPLESLTTPQRLQLEGLEIGVKLNPPVKSCDVKLSPPSMVDLRGDDERIMDDLNHQFNLSCRKFDIDVLKNMSSLLRSSRWEARVFVRDNEVVSISSKHSSGLGLAVDLGTTKIAGYLLDLDSGKTLSSSGVMNPQISYGEDIVSRITYAMESPAKKKKLQEVVVNTLNSLTADLCRRANVEKERIVEAVIVGNTVMHHLLLDLPVDQLAVSPFVPAVQNSLDVKSRDIGLNIAPGAYIHLLPNIAGFVGADHVAMLLATERIWKDDDLVIALDIGTNTEVSLIDNGDITSVSCASGPAFEGAHIKDGMRATNGAIERLQLIGDEVKYQTIGKVPPVGLCGSGILDAIAQLYLAGVISRDGKMNDHPRIRFHNNQKEFVLVNEKENGSPAITITQKDVREIQLAKGAIRSGIDVLLQERGHFEQEIKKVIIAGAFGSYINVASAVSIGMLPPLPLNRFQQVGNAAGIGAKLALLSIEERFKAEAIAHRASYIELAASPDFEKIFLRATYLG